MAHGTNVHKKNTMTLTNANKTSEQTIGGNSVLAIDHKTNETQRPWTIPHAKGLD